MRNTKNWMVGIIYNRSIRRMSTIDQTGMSRDVYLRILSGLFTKIDQSREWCVLAAYIIVQYKHG